VRKKFVDTEARETERKADSEYLHKPREAITQSSIAHDGGCHIWPWSETSQRVVQDRYREAITQLSTAQDKGGGPPGKQLRRAVSEEKNSRLLGLQG
jgi:Ribonuclease G/E